MLITQKKQYALRAIYELAKRKDDGPLKTAEIAQAQAIPLRFLETILNRLKHADLVVAKRGYHGGFRLNRAPHEITVDDIFKALETPMKRAACVSCISESNCPLYGSCSFLPFWEEMQDAIDTICRRTTIQNLLDE